MEHHIATGAIHKNKKRFAHRLHEVKGGLVKLKPPAVFMGKSYIAREQRAIWNDLVKAAGDLLEEQDKYELEQIVGVTFESRQFGPRLSVRRLAAEMHARWRETLRRRREQLGGDDGEDDDFDDDF